MKFVSLLWLLLLKCLSLHASCNFRSITTSQSVVYALPGSEATLFCNYNESQYAFSFMYWYFDPDVTILYHYNHYNYTYIDYSFRNRSINFRPPFGLFIPTVMESDFRFYRCDIGGNFAIVELKRAAQPKVSLLDKTGDQLLVLRGQPARIHCSALGGGPRPSIRWMLGGVDVTGDAIELADGNDVTSVLKITPTAANDGAILECGTVQDAAFTFTLPNVNDSAKLSIYEASSSPKIIANINGVKMSPAQWDNVPVGSLINIQCHFSMVNDTGNPPASLTLEIGSKVVPATGYDISVKREDHEKLVSCKAEQLQLSSLAVKEKITVTMGPLSATLKQVNAPGAENSPMLLTCEGRGVEPASEAKFIWNLGDVSTNGTTTTRTDPGIGFGDGRVFSDLLLTPSFEDDGVVVECVVVNPLNRNANKSATVPLDVTFAPQMSCDRKDITGFLHVICTVVSNPVVDSQDVKVSFPDGIDTDVHVTDGGTKTVVVNFLRPTSGGNFEFLIEARGVAKKFHGFEIKPTKGTTPTIGSEQRTTESADRESTVPPNSADPGLEKKANDCSINEWVTLIGIVVANVILISLIVLLVIIMRRKGSFVRGPSSQKGKSSNDYSHQVYDEGGAQ